MTTLFLVGIVLLLLKVLDSKKKEKSLSTTMLMTPEKANFFSKYIYGREILKILFHNKKRRDNNAIERKELRNRQLYI